MKNKNKPKKPKKEKVYPKKNQVLFVPVIGVDGEPLMPTKPSRARKFIESGQARGFFNKGIFCIKMKRQTGKETQPIVIGVDPGSKKEAYTVKSEAHTYLNVQADAVQHVKKAVKTRREMRRTRRNRNTPCRQPRFHRKGRGLPPSTRARWGFKLRIINWLKKLYPITHVIVEDIRAKTKEDQKKWNKSFSPLEVGKNWFYDQLPGVITRQGYETKKLRDELGLTKSKNKLSHDFDAHCVDSWVLANSVVGGHICPDNKQIFYIRPLQFHRRQLHALKPAKGGARKNYGGTMSMGFKRGSLVRHKKYGLTYVGGTSKNRITLNNVTTGKKITQVAKPEECMFLGYNSWMWI